MTGLAPTPQLVHDDEDLLVVDKPGGMVCHSAQRPEFTSLADWLREHGVATPRMLNRLDRETSGLVVVTKTERAARLLGRAMLRREIAKEYIAICTGILESDSGRIDQPIGLAPGALVYTRRAVVPGGKECVTEFAVVERLNNFTVVQLRPRTGRAHQLRVHLQWLGHPIVGDKIYGPDERLYLEFIEHDVTPGMLTQLHLPRHALHASRVTLPHPGTGTAVSFEAPLPEDMAQFIAEHRQ